jgi:predicted Zn-dependent protease
MLALLAAGGMVLATPGPAQASLIELIFQGIRIIQLATLSDAQEVALGQQINQQLVSQEIQLYQNPVLVDYVNQIGQALAQVSDRPDIPYTFQIVQDDQVNAFSTVGGFVYINTGLLRAADNEAQLASVIAHEIGHIERRHAIQQVQQMALAEGVMALGDFNRSVAVDLAIEFALRRPNSRQHEFEADAAGLAMLQKAGYAPIGAIEFLQKLLDQPAPPAFLSTHPDAADRITVLESQIDPAARYVGKGLEIEAYARRLRYL